MSLTRRRALQRILFACFIALAPQLSAQATVAQGTVAQGLPAKVSDQEFWRMVTQFSEPGGYFRSENFVGNETSLQEVLPDLTKRVRTGGVYIGVAPDQNFTFLVALRPKIAFIVDIRRQNLIQHLVYKASIELSPTRADFLSRLFSRAKPTGLSPTTSIDTLLSAFYGSPPSSTLFAQNLAAVKNHLTRQHGFALTAQDTVILVHVMESFYRAGPEITYNYPSSSGGGGRGGSGGMPTYATMVSGSDGNGARRSYLGSEQLYGVLRTMQLNNLIIPLVGDFAGPRTLRTVGQFVREKGATITTFYTSNVEQYLFQTPDDWSRFYGNMSTWPLDSSSTLIRSAPMANARQAGVIGWPGARSTMLLSYMRDIVASFRSGRITAYGDVLALSKQ